jgi:hypothetical protein
MSAQLKFALLLTLSVLSSCDESFMDSVSDSIVTTDKTSYQLQENVIVTVDNKTGEELSYYVCSGCRNAPYMIQKLAGLNWEPVYAPICNGYMSYCCKSILENELFRDTISWQYFAAGLYRFEYSFQTNEERKEYYSKVFEVR